MKNPPSTAKGLIAELAELEDSPLDPHQVANLLSKADITSENLRPLLHFRDDRYTRNLVYRSDTFDVIVLCWPPGTSTPVHDHGEQWGWVRVLEGALEEVRYSDEGQPEKLDETKKWSPKVHNRVVINAGKDVAAVNSMHGIHSLGTLDEPAISLHIYSKPLDSCLVFGGQGGKIDRKQLAFDTTPKSRAKQPV